MSGSNSTPLPAAVVVRSAFGDYAKGTVITDAKVIEEIHGEGFGGSLIPIHPDAAKPVKPDAEAHGEEH
nr:hypothetical protein [uncultured Lichenicoccus sp.]